MNHTKPPPRLRLRNACDFSFSALVCSEAEARRYAAECVTAALAADAPKK